jgi:hypothetical protein
LPDESFAVTVKEIAFPAVAEVGAASTKWSGEPGETEKLALVADVSPLADALS